MTTIVPHFAEWTFQTDIGRSAQCVVSKSAKKGRSASCGKGVLPIKTCSAKWKVGFVSAQKPFLVITNDKFSCEITVPLTVHRPFRAAIGCSAKRWVRISPGWMEEWRKGRKNLCLKMDPFWTEITKSLFSKEITMFAYVAGESEEPFKSNLNID